MPFISGVKGRQIYEFKDSLVYKVRSRIDSQDCYTEKRCLKIHTHTKTVCIRLGHMEVCAPGPCGRQNKASEHPPPNWNFGRLLAAMGVLGVSFARTAKYS